MATSAIENIDSNNGPISVWSASVPFSTSSAKKGGKCITSKYFKWKALKHPGRILFDIQEQRNDAFQEMDVMKDNSLFSDVTLEVEKEKFQAHKVILSANSPYFKAMFTSGLRESAMDSIKIQGVTSFIMQKVLSFMYSGKIVLTDLIICQVLIAASMFQMTHLLSTCCTFLEQQIGAINVIGIANFARQHGCMDLYRKANIYIEQHFIEVSKQEEFLDITEPQLVNLIGRDELNVYDEKDVYNAVLKWVMFDENQRSCKMEGILTAVRCQYLSPRFLKDQIKNCKIFSKFPACREYLTKIFMDLGFHRRTKQRERRPTVACVIYIVGGYARKHGLANFDCYSMEDKEWIRLPKLPVARSGLAAAFLNGLLYAVGGRITLRHGVYEDSNLVCAFNPVTNRWKHCTPLNFRRNRLDVAVLDKELYAIGGTDGSEVFSSVERYDAEGDRWVMAVPMLTRRTGVSAIVVNRLMYVFGGCDGDNRLSTAECYNPELKQWKYLAPMEQPRGGMGICNVGKFIFCIGGFDGTYQVHNVERYDIETDTWIIRDPLLEPRSAMSVTIWDAKIYVMGGYNGDEFLSSVEVYDIDWDKWNLGESLPWGRSGHGSDFSFQCLAHGAGK